MFTKIENGLQENLKTEKVVLEESNAAYKFKRNVLIVFIFLGENLYP